MTFSLDRFNSSFLASSLARAGLLIAQLPLYGCAGNAQTETIQTERVESTHQAFGIKYTQDVTQAHGHSWIMLKALQYLNARGILPQELQGDEAVRNLTFGVNFADDVFMGRPDQYPQYVWTPTDDDRRAPSQVCGDTCPTGQTCTETCTIDTRHGTSKCQYCYFGGPPTWVFAYYFFGQQRHEDTCDLVPVEYDFTLAMGMSHGEGPEFSPNRPTTAHETSILANASSELESTQLNLDYRTDNLFHYAMADLPSDDPDITSDVRMFPHQPSDFDAGFWGDLFGVDSCAADLMGNQKIVIGAKFGVAKYGSILYQLARRFFDNGTYWPQPDINELIKAGNGSEIPDQWRNGGMDLSPHWNTLHSQFPSTYLGGNPFSCTGPDVDTCAKGAPTWPAFVPKDQYIPEDYNSPGNKAQFRAEITARYPGRNNMAAQVYLGWASHMIQDANLPHHAANWTGNEHKAQEEAGDALADHGEVLYKCPTSGFYSYSQTCVVPGPKGGFEVGTKVIFDQTAEMTHALASRFDSYTDKSQMCDAASITDASLIQAGVNWQSSYTVFLDALKRGRVLAKSQNYGSKGHVPDRLTMIVGVLADAVVDTMKLLYCAPPRTKNASSPECSGQGNTCYPATTHAWNQGTIGATGQRYPMDFNVFAFGDVKISAEDVQGPVAAGGSVTLTSSNLNWGQQGPVGLFSVGYPNLSNGFIYGSLYTGVAGYTVPQGVTLRGNVIATMGTQPVIDFGLARTELQSMSQGLAGYPVKGTMDFLWGCIVNFTGRDPHLNVFTIPATTLAAARSINFAVPASSTVVVNVTGSTATVQNVGFNRAGLSTAQLLWNFQEATTLTMMSVGFPGSVLAPYATVDLEWGNLSGTLVAESVVATSEFHSAPFHNNWLEPM